MRSTFLRGAALGALLLACALAAAPARAEQKPTQGLRYPSLTPDNKQVVFGYRGDIWIAPVDGKGAARRLTIHEAQDTLPRVSPDGKQIAFSSSRNGNYDIYVMSIDGGEPRQVTFHSSGEIVCDWSPDGKRILFMTQREPSLYGLELYEVDVAGGTPRRITWDGGRDGSYAPDGVGVVYARGFNDIYWDNYEGSANYDLQVVDKPGQMPRTLAETGRNERYPFYAKDGKSVYFVAEEKGVANFWSEAADGQGEAKKVTAFKEDVWRPDLSWDGQTVVFEMVGRLYWADLTEAEPKAHEIPIVVQSDVRHSGIEVRTLTTGLEQPDVSADGSMIAFSLHGNIWTMQAGGGEAKQVTDSPGKDEWPRFGPSGQRIAYQSDAGGDSNIYLRDLRSGETRQLTSNKANDFFHAWSPDGRKLVFTSERSGNRDIWLLDVESGEEKQLTNHPAADDDATFSPDGRWIAFDSAREGTQAIYVMPADGGPARRVSQGAGFFQVPAFSPDSALIVFEAFNPASGGSGGLFVVSAFGGPQVQIAQDGATARWSARGDTIYFVADRGDGNELFRMPAPKAVDAGERVPFMAKVDVDLKKELGDLFDEAWERMKEGFYDAKMHDVDWDKMRAKYRDMAVDAENKDEFHNYIRQMLAELGASHLGIRGGDRPTNVASPDVPETGSLGLELEPVPADGGGRKVVSVMPAGPADQAGLRPGDVIVGIGRTKLKPDTNLDTLLAGSVGREVPVVFQPITAEGLGSERRVTVTPASINALGQLVYRQWVERGAKLVNERSKGHLGYIHLDGMNPQNLQRFRQAVAQWNQNRRIEGMVLDVRFNGGGNIHEQLMEVLRARPYAYMLQRGSRQKIYQPVLYWDKPVVVLVNERSFSDAEVFPHAFQTAGMGKVVGVPTPGGVIGTNDITLSDGSRFRIPRTGFYMLDGTNMEGNGVQPDFVVPESPEDRLKGRDPQLEKAVEVVTAEIQARKAAAKAAKPEAPKPETPKPETPQPETPQPESPQPTPPTPEPKPTPTPEPRPTAKASALDPLADVEVGEWVRYRLTFGGTETVVKTTVVAVEDGQVRFAKDVERGGEFMPPLPDEIAQGPVLDALATMGGVRGHTVTTGAVRGETAEILRVEMDWGGLPVTLVFSNAVPGLGLWQVEANKQVLLEAVEWGREVPESPAGNAAAPAAEPARPVARTPESPKPEPAQPEAPKPEAAKPEATAPAVPGRPPSEARPADESGLPNPLRDAQVGDWVKMRQVLPDGEAVVTMRVTEVTADEVVLESTVERGGEKVDGPAMRRPRSEPLGFGRMEGATFAEETVTVGGREVRCTVVTTKSRRGGEMRRWLSADVPVTGTVRVEREGRVIRELLDFGRGAR